MTCTCRWLARLSLAFGLVLLLLGVSQQLAAQEPTPQEPAAQEQTAEEKAAAAAQAEKEGLVRLTEEVTVTGSLIPRKDLEALSPVSVIELEEITYQGTGRIEDVVQSLPQVFAAQNSTIANGASGTATVSLRNMGSVRTLVLINGRRMPAGDALGQAAADLNFIPSMLVNRVDVLTGGASSVYGADAVAGVVNFVLDTDFEGVRGGIQWNGYQHNNNNEVAAGMNEARGFDFPSGSTWNKGGFDANLAVGGKFAEGKGHASAYIDFRDISDIRKDARDYTNCSAGRGSQGPVCSGSGTIPEGRFLVYDADFGFVGDYVVDQTTGNTMRRRVGTDVFNYAPYNFMQRPDRKYSGGGFAQYTINEHFEPYAEVQFMDDYTDAQIAPSGNFGNTGVINCDNPMMSAQQRDLLCTQAGFGPNDYANVTILRRNVEGGPRVSQLRHTDWRLLAGMRGDINESWSYDVYGLHAQVNSPQSYINDLNFNRVVNALDVIGTPGDPSSWQCRSGDAGCVPWNLFQAGGVTQEAIDYITGVAHLMSGTDTQMVSAVVTGDLKSAGVAFPSATEGIQIALGAEYRKEHLYVDPDEVFAAGTLTGQGGATVGVDGEFNVKELFVEALVPVVQDTAGFQDLSLELGYRLSDYSRAGTNSSYKAQLAWAPNKDFKLRFGYNRAARAPNARELFVPQAFGLGGSEDICANDPATGVPSATAAQCANTGVSAAQYGRILSNPAGQYSTLGGGNPDLEVETADTITAGLVWTPQSITGLSATLDFYDIKVTDVIGNLNADDIVRTCAETGDPTLCSLIHRDPAGTLWLIPNVAYTETTNQNIGGQRARGVDLTARYPWNLGDHGFINFSLIGSYMLKSSLEDPLIEYDCVGYFGNQCAPVPVPRWRHRMRASWQTNFKTTFSIGWRYIHKMLNDDASDDPDLSNEGLIESWRVNDFYEIPSTHYIDFAATYAFRDGIRLTAGVNNILDKEPPIGPDNTWNDYGPGFYGTYDHLGRAVYTNLQFEF